MIPHMKRVRFGLLVWQKQFKDTPFGTGKLWFFFSALFVILYFCIQSFLCAYKQMCERPLLAHRPLQCVHVCDMISCVYFMNVVVSFIVNLSTAVNHFPSVVSLSLCLYLIWPFLHWHAHTRHTYIHTFQCRSVRISIGQYSRLQYLYRIGSEKVLSGHVFKCFLFFYCGRFCPTVATDINRVSKRINRQTNSYLFDLSG